MNNIVKQVYDMHQIDKEGIRKNILNEKNPEKKSFRFRPAIAFVLILVFVITCFSGYNIIVEAKEYRKAVAFFEEYGLSTEGLSRSEIKEIYKDITMKTYSFEKTHELLNTISVEMYSTELGTVDRDSLEALWNRRLNAFSNPDRTDKSSIWYEVEFIRLNPETEHYEIPITQTVIVKHNAAGEVWRYGIPYDMYVSREENMHICEDGVIIYGQAWGNLESAKKNIDKAVVFMLNGDGELLWEHMAERDMTEYDTAAVSGNEITLFGRRLENHTNTDGTLKNQKYFSLFTVITTDGTVLIDKETEDEEFKRYETAVKTGDYYLVKQLVRDSEYGMQSELVSFSETGEITNKFTYVDEGTEYQIQDIIYYEGRVYLSAMMPHMQNDKFNDEAGALLKQYYDKWYETERSMQPGETMTVDAVKMPAEYYEQLRDLFTQKCSAVLLVCDEDAVIKEAYSVENSQPAKLETDSSGQLTWQIMRVDDVKNVSLFLSSRSLDILATEFSFVFDKEGKLIGKNEVGPYALAY